VNLQRSKSIGWEREKYGMDHKEKSLSKCVDGEQEMKGFLSYYYNNVILNIKKGWKRLCIMPFALQRWRRDKTWEKKNSISKDGCREI
jgi:hypothetical protein